MISGHVREEWGLALKEGKGVILVIFDAVDLSKCGDLRKRQSIKLE